MRELRISLAMVVTVLIAFGLIMIYSSSGVYALKEKSTMSYYLLRHMVFLGLGFLGMFTAMVIDYRILRRWSKPLMLVTMGLLALVLIPEIGSMSFGARRWFKIGPISFQPSELAKVTMMIYVADFLARKRQYLISFRQGFLPVMLILAMLCLMVVRQPDLGNALLISSITMIMMFVAGMRLSHLSGVVILMAPLLYFLVVSAPYRLRRIIAFLDPWQDKMGVGFQLTQSQIALGSGGIFGVGLGQSTQKLLYLPAAHTDFVLSIIGEELGLLGTVTIVVLFGMLIWIGSRIIKQTEDDFGYFLGLGIVSMLGLQAIVNIGVSIGALPTKGLPLPFISYGGSSLMFNMIAIGLLLNISRTEDLAHDNG